MELNKYFAADKNLGDAIREFFKDIIGIEINTPTKQPLSVNEFVSVKNEIQEEIKSLFFAGRMSQKTIDKVSDAVSFDEVEKTLEERKYKTILIFGVDLNLGNPTRTKLSQITRLLNVRSKGAPVVVIFRYNNHLAYANIERMDYKQEGEKVGKVSILRDIGISNPHAGHIKILSDLRILKSRKSKVDSFEKLYKHWQEVFSVSLLNKKFYQELSNWYFWATQHVTFPGEPTRADAHHKNAKLEDQLQEHKATNVIRMLTRLLFVWFIKEKKLIPEELFELDALQKDILNEISPYSEKDKFKEQNKQSVYYKAILQNLFFATLNCPIEGDSLDKRKRGFRGEGYGTHRGIDYLMRYKSYFKNPNAFLKKLNDVVPFLNGGLFECLDDKFKNLYIDGFSDQMTTGEQLIVPDYLFFGVEEKTDLSAIVGIKDKKYKKADVKGLINILKSYKFTISENTPIEEDVALDPELLGRVFENLLASYNPETKTTAREQTGSFYTPREIVNYMVDESLIAYLKNAITDWGGLDDETMDKELHILTSFDSKVPFADNPELQREIITALSTCTILDPACGSGAFPMGILQKMVHILQKLDQKNMIWKEVQLAKAEQDSKAAFEIEDKQTREERLLEINQAFDQSINDPDYARKLFLIENCIHGVDIQPIATQISKLRFFISLVVEQKVNADKDNFGIRPLPNLETKFVAANTLIGIEKPNAQLSLYDTKEVKALEAKLKKVRSKLFSAKSKETKLKYQEEFKVLRNQIAEELEKSGWKGDTAQKLAGWDPYNQNASSPFYFSEWMFGLTEGFDIVIGNPPYGGTYSKLEKEYFKVNYKSAKTIPRKQKGSLDTFTLFIEQGFNTLHKNGCLAYIVPISITSSDSMTGIHNLLESNCEEIRVSSYAVRPQPIFQNAVVNTSILFFTKTETKCKRIYATKMYRKNDDFNLQYLLNNLEFIDVYKHRLIGRYPKISFDIERKILDKIFSQKTTSIGELIKPEGRPIYYRTTGGRYYKVVTNFSTGSTKETSILFDKKVANSIGAILSSTLYFWFYQIYSNNLDMRFYEIESFKIPYEKLTEKNIGELEEIYKKYLLDIVANSNLRITKRYANIEEFTEYKIGKSKHLIDQIDDIIAPLYGLTAEELNFIKNYEIQFRLQDDE